MNKANYVVSLKNKEFLINKQLCDDSISQTEKEKIVKDLKKVCIEIKT